MISSLPDTRQQLLDTVEQSYANNSQLYRFMADSASLEQMVTYLYWDSQQPVFRDYIARWLPKASGPLREQLELHIEEEQDHAQLFSRMMEGLLGRVSIDRSLDTERLAVLNYTFSPQCAENENFGFFCGGFFATELMASKRYDQLIAGFDRLDIPRGEIEFIVIHSDCEPAHSMQALDDLLMPLIAESGNNLEQVEAGIEDRLQRSATFIKWYEKTKLGL